MVEPVKKRGPGAPRGPRKKPDIGHDARPAVIDFFASFITNKRRKKKLEKHLDSLPPEELTPIILAVARILGNVSPKTQEVNGGQEVRLFINGMEQNRAIDGVSRPVLDVTPPADLSAPTGALAASVGTSREKLPGSGPREVCPEFLDRKRGPVDTTPAPDPPPKPKGYIFTVPKGPDEGGIPKEWRGSHYDD